jgi:large subunit ribosomal protein LP0
LSTVPRLFTLLTTITRCAVCPQVKAYLADPSAFAVAAAPAAGSGSAAPAAAAAAPEPEEEEDEDMGFSLFD